MALDAATGKARWEVSYPVEISQNYGITDAPRSSPVIDPATGAVIATSGGTSCPVTRAASRATPGPAR